MFNKALPNLEFVASLGNHDVFPTNVEDFNKPFEQKTVNLVARNWQNLGWLDSNQELEFSKNGFYSRSINIGSQKVEVISLNMNACDIANWDLAHGRNDPGH